MKNEMIRLEDVITMIYWIRNEKVILDRDLARLYGVETKVLKQAVKRNISRFPSDFMFILDKHEFTNWRSQIVTSKSDNIGLRYPPMAFTEQGVAMLSQIQARIDRIELEINGKLSDHHDKIQLILEAIKQLIAPPAKERKQIGFRRNEKNCVL